VACGYRRSPDGCGHIWSTALADAASSAPLHTQMRLHLLRPGAFPFAHKRQQPLVCVRKTACSVGSCLFVQVWQVFAQFEAV